MCALVFCLAMMMVFFPDAFRILSLGVRWGLRCSLRCKVRDKARCNVRLNLERRMP